jgi:hypothetical protein
VAANTTILTSIKGLTAPTAPTATASKNAGMDYVGMTSAAYEALTQAKRTLTALVASTDAGDPNLATLNNILLSLS